MREGRRMCAAPREGKKGSREGRASKGLGPDPVGVAAVERWLQKRVKYSSPKKQDQQLGEGKQERKGGVGAECTTRGGEGEMMLAPIRAKTGL
jgi:hypothetical protein